MALNFANNNSLSAITTQPSGLSGGALNLISTQTASSSSTISFTSGIDSTYDAYVFKFINIHPQTQANPPGTDDIGFLTFQGSTDTGSSYGVTMTSTYFYATHSESGSSGFGYSTGNDLAQSTNFQRISPEIGNDNDQCVSGTLTLFNPSSTTFVKHFINTSQSTQRTDYSWNSYTAGYFNTTSAIDAIQFKIDSGNIDSGVIKLYGIS